MNNLLNGQDNTIRNYFLSANDNDLQPNHEQLNLLNYYNISLSHLTNSQWYNLIKNNIFHNNNGLEENKNDQLKDLSYRVKMMIDSYNGIPQYIMLLDGHGRTLYYMLHHLIEKCNNNNNYGYNGNIIDKITFIVPEIDEVTYKWHLLFFPNANNNFENNYINELYYDGCNYDGDIFEALTSPELNLYNKLDSLLIYFNFCSIDDKSLYNLDEFNIFVKNINENYVYYVSAFVGRQGTYYYGKGEDIFVITDLNKFIQISKRKNFATFNMSHTELDFNIIEINNNFNNEIDNIMNNNNEDNIDNLLQIAKMNYNYNKTFNNYIGAIKKIFTKSTNTLYNKLKNMNINNKNYIIANIIKLYACMTINNKKSSDFENINAYIEDNIQNNILNYLIEQNKYECDNNNLKLKEKEIAMELEKKNMEANDYIKMPIYKKNNDHSQKKHGNKLNNHSQQKHSNKLNYYYNNKKQKYNNNKNNNDNLIIKENNNNNNNDLYNYLNLNLDIYDNFMAIIDVVALLLSKKIYDTGIIDLLNKIYNYLGFDDDDGNIYDIKYPTYTYDNLNQYYYDGIDANIKYLLYSTLSNCDKVISTLNNQVGGYYNKYKKYKNKYLELKYQFGSGKKNNILNEEKNNKEDNILNENNDEDDRWVKCGHSNKDFTSFQRKGLILIENRCNNKHCTAYTSGDIHCSRGGGKKYGYVEKIFKDYKYAKEDYDDFKDWYEKRYGI